MNTQIQKNWNSGIKNTVCFHYDLDRRVIIVFIYKGIINEYPTFKNPINESRPLVNLIEKTPHPIVPGQQQAIIQTYTRVVIRPVVFQIITTKSPSLSCIRLDQKLLQHRQNPPINTPIKSPTKSSRNFVNFGSRN